ncbi:centrosomal protein of 152 kDa isoform X2 [Protopterus annectens]|uniref:centrosomal protein of 152 kDa isoform X2 n=1 Tax=Protopterus annectens TaxID=7888 RepID=UPI001CFBED51|nr:centrosomal protein of 152 kDa isoform X2 [Protopterus annectens]
MSIDFDSAALQTQHEDEEFDKEDYAREQELQQLLTDLPDDMLEDSRDMSSPEMNYSDCSESETAVRNQQPWQQNKHWNAVPTSADLQKSFEEDYEVQYEDQCRYDQASQQTGFQDDVKQYLNVWNKDHNEEKHQYKGKGYSYQSAENNEALEDSEFHNRDKFSSEAHFQLSSAHLPTDVSQINRDPLRYFLPHGPRRTQALESYTVKYKPYKPTIESHIALDKEIDKEQRFEEMQRDFLDAGEDSLERQQIAQLQALYKARGRMIEELQQKHDENDREIRYLKHQFAIIKDEKDGLLLSLQESKRLVQEGIDREVLLQGQVKALEAKVETLNNSEEESLKKLKVAEVAVESLQQQLMELKCSEALTRVREQHETVIATLKQKHERKLLAVQQELDAAKCTLEQKNESCQCLEERVKFLERQLEEIKLEKVEIINRLTKSLQESQQQCSNLLQTGSLQEITQLRFQLQQAQSAKVMSDNMIRALQEELSEIKEQMAIYESAAKVGVFLNGSSGDTDTELSESYIELGIKKCKWKTAHFHSSLQNGMPEKEVSKDDIVLELKTELERSLGSIRRKRCQVTRLQDELKESQKQVMDLRKQLENAQQMVKSSSVENRIDINIPLSAQPCEMEGESLETENRVLQERVKNLQRQIQEVNDSEEKLKGMNQELCNEMRQMVCDFDHDKQEAIQRLEKTYEQHHDDIKACIREELLKNYADEKEQLKSIYEEQILLFKTKLEEVNQEMLGVQECYITVCKEKDSLEQALMKMEQERKNLEEKLKEQLSKQKDNELKSLKDELEEKHRTALTIIEKQYINEREADVMEKVKTQVALAKSSWKEEQDKIKEFAIMEAVKEIEAKWQLQVIRITEEFKNIPFVEKRDCTCQTEQSCTQQVGFSPDLETAFEKQKQELEQAAQKEKMCAVEEALRNLEMELERKHQKDITKLIEAAVANAKSEWLQELTNFPEYRASLKTEKAKWEKEHEREVSQQLSVMLKAAEEKWKNDCLKELPKFDKNGTLKELQDQALKRELELKKEEMAALLKTELAKARTQWNKEKQEEIKRIHELNEKDYRAFLDEHKTKISDILKAANEDFERQKTDLLIQKEAEMNSYFEEKKRELMLHATKKSQFVKEQYEKELLVEIEFVLSDIQEQLLRNLDVDCQRKKLYSTPKQIQTSCHEKLRTYLEKAFENFMRKMLELQRNNWNEKKEEKKSYTIQESAVHHEEKVPLANHKSENICQQSPIPHQAHTEKHKTATTIKAVEKDDKLFRNLQETEGALDKITSLQKEETEDLCKLCSRGLAELRNQYMKAVGRIRGDMLRYIHESKERAAEILRKEVLRERQETARKMRKYYLICLQQLLSDSGKDEGAEKKIMNAASKLAAMAKVLETPLHKKKHKIYSALEPTVVPEEDNHDSGQEFSACKERKVHPRSKNSNVYEQLSNQAEKNLPCGFAKQSANVISTKQSATCIAMNKGKQILASVKKNGDALPVETTTVCLHRKIHSGFVAEAVQMGQIKCHSPSQENSQLGSICHCNTSDSLSDSASENINLQKKDKEEICRRLEHNYPEVHHCSKSECAKFFNEKPVKDGSGDCNSFCIDFKIGSCHEAYSSQSLRTVPLRDYVTQLPSSVLSLASDIKSSSGAVESGGVHSKKHGDISEGQNGKTNDSKRNASFHKKEHFSHVSKHRSQACVSPDSGNFSSVGKTSTTLQSSDTRKASRLHGRKLVTDPRLQQQDSGIDSPLTSDKLPNRNS